MKKIAALDLGDKWTGIAISDPLCMFPKPYTTVQTKELFDYLEIFLTKEPIKSIVVGLPKTMRGSESEQARKVRTLFQQLQESFTEVAWHLCDERLSSKRAKELKKPRTKEEKLRTHAIAATFILSTYLMQYSIAQSME